MGIQGVRREQKTFFHIHSMTNHQRNSDFNDFNSTPEISQKSEENLKLQCR